VIVADVLDLDTGDTLAGQLYDTPVVVGAVAENQTHLHDNGIMQTPAGRAASLGRHRANPGGGEFGPPGSGDVTGYIPAGGFGDYSEDDFVKPRKGRKWLKVSLYSALTLAVVGGGLYGGWRWTQTQYYVGAKGEHLALYRGISQDLAWVSLSKVEKDHPEIELKYLPQYQQKQVEETIPASSLQGAQKKLDELSVQASACKKQAQEGSSGTGSSPSASKPSPTPSAGASSSPSASPSPTATQAASPSPGPTLSQEEERVVSLCGKQ